MDIRELLGLNNGIDIFTNVCFDDILFSFWMALIIGTFLFRIFFSIGYLLGLFWIFFETSLFLNVVSDSLSSECDLNIDSFESYELSYYVSNISFWIFLSSFFLIVLWRGVEHYGFRKGRMPRHSKTTLRIITIAHILLVLLAFGYIA